MNLKLVQNNFDNKILILKKFLYELFQVVVDYKKIICEIIDDDENICSVKENIINSIKHSKFISNKLPRYFIDEEEDDYIEFIDMYQKENNIAIFDISLFDEKDFNSFFSNSKYRFSLTKEICDEKLLIDLINNFLYIFEIMELKLNKLLEEKLYFDNGIECTRKGYFSDIYDSCIRYINERKPEFIINFIDTFREVESVGYRINNYTIISNESEILLNQTFNDTLVDSYYLYLKSNSLNELLMTCKSFCIEARNYIDKNDSFLLDFIEDEDEVFWTYDFLTELCHSKEDEKKSLYHQVIRNFINDDNKTEKEKRDFMLNYMNKALLLIFISKNKIKRTRINRKEII